MLERLNCSVPVRLQGAWSHAIVSRESRDEDLEVAETPSVSSSILLLPVAEALVVGQQGEGQALDFKNVARHLKLNVGSLWTSIADNYMLGSLCTPLAFGRAAHTSVTFVL